MSARPCYDWGMRRAALTFFAIASLGLLACGDSYTSVTPNDAAAPDAPASDAAAPDAAPLVCTGSLTACGTACVDTATNGDHCGRCDHGCGGGECSGGICRPQIVRAGGANDATFAVGPGGVFVVDGQDVVRCPLAGCKGQPEKVVTFIQQKPGPLVATGTDRVFFLGAPEQTTYRPNIYHCPIVGACTLQAVDTDGLGSFSAIAAYKGEVYTWSSRGLGHATCTAAGCGVKETLMSGAGSAMLHADDTGVYYIDNAGALMKLPVSGTAALPVVVATGLGTGLLAPVAIRSFGGKIYVALPGDGANRGIVKVCTPTACDAKSFGNRVLGNVSDMAVDAQGLYWLDDKSKLRRCPLAGCGAAIDDVVSTLSGAENLVAYGGFLYYVTRGAAPTIWRVAE